MIRYSFIDTSWGPFAYVAGNNGLLDTYLPDWREKTIEEKIRRRFPGAVLHDRCLPDFEDQVCDYFHGTAIDFAVPIDLSSQSPFRRQVLKACRQIRYGQTASYTDLAKAVGKPRAGRAVGSTMANNPLPLVIPCHRILRHDGSLGGFSSPRGTRTKQRLLDLEAGP